MIIPHNLIFSIWQYQAHFSLDYVAERSQRSRAGDALTKHRGPHSELLMGKLWSCHTPALLHIHQWGTTVWVTPCPPSCLSKGEMPCRPCKGCCWGTFKPHTSIPETSDPTTTVAPNPSVILAAFCTWLCHWLTKCHQLNLGRKQSTLLTYTHRALF